jgi:hypothetical protein
VSVCVNRLLGVPTNPRQLGWWGRRYRPGMPSRSVVIDGHVDSAALGLGALFRFREAPPGDDVLLMNAACQRRFDQVTRHHGDDGVIYAVSR